MSEPVSGRYLAALYADDVREEVGGKLSIIGVYQERLLVSEFPFVLPKFAVVMIAGTPVEQPFTTAEFILLNNDDVVSTFPLPKEALDVMKEHQREKATVHEIQLVHVLPAFRVEGPCVIQARLKTEQGVLAARPLEIDRLSSL